jgi:hypothetical protein
MVMPVRFNTSESIEAEAGGGISECSFLLDFALISLPQRLRGTKKPRRWFWWVIEEIEHAQGIALC